MGVIGVHGKPGMRGTAAVLEKTTLVVAFAVSELSVLLCNLHGLQVRKLVEVTTDSFGLAMHFEAELSVTADVATVCKRLVEFLPKSLAELSSSAMHAATVVCGGRYVWWASIERAEAMALETNANRVIKALRARVARKAGLSTDVAAPRQPAPTLRAPTAMLKTVARSSYCHQAQLLARLGPRLGANDVVCVDTGDITLWTSLSLRLRRGSVVLSSERLGTMGYALCAGIVASAQRGPSATGIVIAGDGGFQMTLNELGTAIQMNSRLVIIVIDNKVLGRVEFGFNNAQGCALAGPDYLALARAYGADGIQLTDDSQIDAALDAAFAASGVFMLHVVSDPDVKAEMATYKPRGIVKVDSA